MINKSITIISFFGFFGFTQATRDDAFDEGSAGHEAIAINGAAIVK
jgi:hypothetical protein